MKRSLALGLGIGALALAACQVIAGIERVDKVDATDVPDGSSSSSGSTISKNDPCAHIVPPDVPDKNDPGDDLPPFVLAAPKLLLTEPGAGGLAGYDLDLSCTCDPRNGTNQDGGSSCKPRGKNQVKCDLDGGIDNEALKLFTQFNQYDDLDKSFADDAKAGKRTILVFIKNWNGKPNDLEVGAGVFVSNGANPFDNGKPTAPPPIEEGGSDWSYPSDFKVKDGILQPTSPLPGGYVRDGKLVVKGAGTVTLLLGSNGLTFNEAIVVGDLTRDDASGIVKFAGVIGGRIRDTDLLSAAGQLLVAGKDPACEYLGGGIFNGIIKPAICAATDLPQGQRSDFKDSECDSISSSIGIEAYSAKISGDAPVDIPSETTPNPCSPSIKGTDYYKCP